MLLLLFGGSGSASSPKYGWDDRVERMPMRRKSQLLAVDSKEEEVWKFTATATPKPFGFDWNPQFPVRPRVRWMPAQWDSKEEEIWPFTATKTPTAYGLDWNAEYPIRPRVWARRVYNEQTETWPVTVVKTPTAYGFEAQQQSRPPPRKLLARQGGEDVLYPHVVMSALAWGWENEWKAWVYTRRHPQLPDEPAEQWLISTVPTPVGFGFDWPPQFPIRNKPRSLATDSKEWEIWPLSITHPPTQFGWNVEPEFAIRRLPRHVWFDPEILLPTNAPTVVLGIVPDLVPLDYSMSRSWIQRTARAVNGALRGNIGATLQVTLAPHNASTTFTDARITPTAHIALTPQTLSAAVAMTSGMLYVIPGLAQAVIVHPNVAATDQTFSVAIIR